MNYNIFKSNKCSIISKDHNGITFVVDSNLPDPKNELWFREGKDLEQEIIESSDIINKEKPCLTSSFRNDKLGWVGADVLYKCIIDAYADHRHLILSPDMIWLVLCQAFSHHINTNAEKYRLQLVNHAGKKDILVQTSEDLLSENANWSEILESFFVKILSDTKDNFANSIASNFSTTGIAERIASQITIMDVVKPFYHYSAMRCVCGIPQITLEGTTEDWMKIWDKIDYFDKFDLQEWTAKLRPIIEEFINASEGNVNSKFWKSIVCKYNPKSLRGISCGPKSRPSKLDGWFLELFPFNSDGERYKTAYYDSTDMLSEVVRVEMDFIEQNPSTGDNKKYPMELIAGFIGVEEMKDTKALRPRIGWMVKEADSSEDKFVYLDDLKEHQITLRIDNVPEELKSLKHIKDLWLEFTGKIIIPDWMDNIEIDEFFVEGTISSEEEAKLVRRFPNISISSR